jgi:hypothetical protein
MAKNINPETEAKRKADISARLKALWQDPEYVAKIKAGRKRAWQRPEYQAKMAEARKAQWAKPGHKEMMSEMTKKLWQDQPEKMKAGHEKALEARKKQWQDPGHVEMMSEMMKRNWQEQPEKMAAGREKALEAKRANPIETSRVGIPNGMKREEAEKAWEEAGKRANIAIRGFERMGILTEQPIADGEIPDDDDGIAKLAMREMCKIAFGPSTDVQMKLNAYNTILTFTRAKPAKRIEGTTNVSAEDWLTEALRIGMAAASDNVSCH